MVVKIDTSKSQEFPEQNGLDSSRVCKFGDGGREGGRGRLAVPDLRRLLACALLSDTLATPAGCGGSESHQNRGLGCSRLHLFLDFVKI